MNPHPTLFSELLNRIAPALTSAEHSRGPLIGSAVEMPDRALPEKSPVWVILHSITESDLRLIHSRPLNGKKLAVQIAANSGEILRIQLAAAESKRKGDLYETTAEFLT